MNDTFCLTFPAAGGSSAFAISFEGVSVGPGSHDVKHCQSMNMMSSFTSLCSKLKLSGASEEFDMPVPNLFKEQSRKQVSTTNSYTRERVTFPFHLLHLFT